MIAVQNIIDNDKSLLTIIFDRTVMKHLRCKCDDYLIVMQSNFKPSYFLLVKADNGYRIKRSSNIKKTYQVSVGHKFNFINEFDFTECTYFLKKNSTIRVILKVY